MADCLQILARVGGEELIRQIHHQAAQRAIFDYEELIFPLLLLHTQTVPVACTCLFSFQSLPDGFLLQFKFKCSKNNILPDLSPSE